MIVMYSQMRANAACLHILAEDACELSSRKRGRMAATETWTDLASQQPDGADCVGVVCGEHQEVRARVTCSACLCATHIQVRAGLNISGLFQVCEHILLP